jgi:hypothetical protein
MRSDKLILDKTIRFGTIPTHGGGRMSVFCRIQITEDGILSIHGTEGPTQGGNCIGACGQIVHDYRDDHYLRKNIHWAPGWDATVFKTFVDVWDRWHLNDMRAGCEHQTGPEWKPKRITLRTYTLKIEIVNKRAAYRSDLLRRLGEGETVTPTIEQASLLHLQSEVTRSGDLPPDISWYYECTREESKWSDWIHPHEHPEGTLNKPCPVCGHPYGHDWRKEDLPEDVVEFLRALPDADRKPAWV